jgi:hypothetical protein
MSSGISRITALVHKVIDPKTVCVHHSQLERVLNGDLKIGPLTCREWSRHAQARFDQYSAKNWQFREFYPDITAYFSVESGKLDTANRLEGIQSSMRQSFNFRFAARIAEATGLSHDQLLLPSFAYLALRELAGTIAVRKSCGLPFADLIKNGNPLLKQYGIMVY